MFLQGNLQLLFDALFHMGVIDPVLDMDWNEAFAEMTENQNKVSSVVQTANQFQGDLDELMVELDKHDEEALGFLAMEVAREFADFHSRSSVH